MNVVAFDPSINTCGAASWVDGSLRLKLLAPTQDTLTLEGKLCELFYNAFDFLSVKPTPDYCLIEKPGSQGTRSIASVSSDSYTKLCLAAGVIAGAAMSHGILVELIPVHSWKGQLPKRITKQRMEEKYKLKCKTDDEADALGILDWWLGKNT